MSSPRRILFVEINEDGTVGGSHTALLDIVRHLDRTRFEPVVLYYQDNSFAERVRALGARVVTWDDERREESGHGLGPVLRRLARPVTLVRAVRRRRALLREARIDLVHVNNSPSFTYEDWLPAAKLEGLPIVSHVRGDLVASRRLGHRMLVPRFDRLLAISEYMAEHVRAEGVPAELLELVHDGVDGESVRARANADPAATRAALGVRDGEVLVTMIGHLRRWKGHAVVLEALRRLEPEVLGRLRVVFAGAADPYEPSHYEDMQREADAEPLRGRVTLLGPRTDAPDLMRAADVVLHASTSPEPFGLVLVEAMALGKPVLASALGAPSEIVTPGCGWTFSPDDPDALAAALRSVVRCPERAEALAEGARQRACEFDVRDTVRRLEHLYERLLPRAS